MSVGGVSPPEESPWFPAIGAKAKTSTMASESAGITGGGGTAASANWVLATINGWICDGRAKEETVAKIMKAFKLVDLREAASDLRKGNWCVPQISVTQESAAGAAYSRSLAEKVFDGLVSIQNQDLNVHFYVASPDLLKVPGARQYFEDQMDEDAVSARLACVDVQLGLVLEKMKSTEQLSSMVEALAKTVTELKEELKESKQVNLQQAEAMKKAAGAFETSVQLHQQAKEQEMPLNQSYAAVAGADGRSRLLTLQNNRTRGRSGSTKRRREGNDNGQHPSQKQRLEVLQAAESRNAHPSPPGSVLSQDLASLAARGGSQDFVQVQRRRRGGQIQRGSAQVNAEGGEKAPFSVFLSGTHPSTTEEVVKEKLTECAAAVSSGDEDAKEFKILKVEHIPLNIPSGEVPRSRCWKVQVEPAWAEHMMKSEAYPAAWGWRKWHTGPRRGQRNEDGGA